MQTSLAIVQIVISVVLVVVVLMQTRGSGFSATFSSDTSIYRTRRGVEKHLFNFTIVLVACFALISILSVLAS